MTITLHEFERNQETNLYKIIPPIANSPIDTVKFALFCAKDCFHLTNEQNKPLAQHCIQLIESWLVDPHSVTQQLEDVAYASADAAYATPENNSIHAIYASVVVCATADSVVTSTSAACASVTSAAKAFRYRTKKRIQYRHYAYSLLRSTTTTNFQTKGKITDKVTLMALLDELSDLNENLIIHTNNKVVLNHPSYPATNTLPELVNLIWNNQSFLHYLEHLYGNSKT